MLIFKCWQTGQVSYVTYDFDMGAGVVAGPRILARLTKEQVNMIREMKNES